MTVSLSEELATHYGSNVGNRAWVHNAGWHCIRFDTAVTLSKMREPCNGRDCNSRVAVTEVVVLLLLSAEAGGTTERDAGMLPTSIATTNIRSTPPIVND